MLTGNIFIPVFYTLLQLLFLLALGYYLARFRGWEGDFFKKLSRFIVKVALPIYFFVRISRTNLDDVKRGIFLPLLAIILTMIGLMVSIPIFRFLKMNKQEKRVGIGMSSFGNSGYIPLTLIEIFPFTLPIIAEKFNVEVSSLYVGIYLLVQSPLLWSVGNFLVTSSGKRIRLKDFISPPLVGISTGLLIVFFNLQHILFNPKLPFLHIYKAMDRISAVTLPMIMLSLGSMIANLKFENNNRIKLFKLAITVSGIRFLIYPATFFTAYFLFLKNLNLNPILLWVIFLEMHIPPATNLSVMAIQAGINEDSVSFTLFFTYIAYLIFLPIYLYLFLNLPGIL